MDPEEAVEWKCETSHQRVKQEATRRKQEAACRKQAEALAKIAKAMPEEVLQLFQKGLEDVGLPEVEASKFSDHLQSFKSFLSGVKKNLEVVLEALRQYRRTQLTRP